MVGSSVCVNVPCARTREKRSSVGSKSARYNSIQHGERLFFAILKRHNNICRLIIQEKSQPRFQGLSSLPPFPQR